MHVRVRMRGRHGLVRASIDERATRMHSDKAHLQTWMQSCADIDAEADANAYID